MNELSHKSDPAHGRFDFYEEERACNDHFFGEIEAPEVGEWAPLAEAIAKWAGFTEQRRSLAELKAQVNALERKLSEFPKSGSITVPICTFDPGPFDLLKEIKVVVRPCDDEFLATFFDANVNASGCNETDAVNSLKDMLLRRFDYLDKMPIEKLGPALVKQITVLRTFIRRRN